MAYPIELVAPSSLRPHPRNYREHPEQQLAHVEASLKEHGFYRNIVVSEDSTILAGHAVWKAAGRLGLEAVPVLRLPLDAEDPKALKVLAGDNEMGVLADVDDRGLSEILKEIKETDDLLGTGYDGQMLAALLFTTRPASEVQTKDDAAAWVGMPEFQRTERPQKLVLLFPDEEARSVFCQTILKVDQPGIARLDTWSMWWPPRAGRKTGAGFYDDGAGVSAGAREMSEETVATLTEDARLAAAEAEAEADGTTEDEDEDGDPAKEYA